MRQNIVTTKNIVNMVHMPYLGKGGTSLGINFGTAAVVFENYKIVNYSAQYDYICYYETDDDGVPFNFPTINERYKAATTDNFAKMPGSPIAYWVSDNVLACYKEKNIYDYAKPCKGIDTGDNNLFLRFWFEVNQEKQFIPQGEPVTQADFSTKKWFPYNKGGNFRKWYGNNEYLLNWECNGEVLKNFKGSNLRNKDCYFRKGVTWSTITSGDSSFRYFDCGFLFDNGGSCLFAENKLLYIQGLLNSIVSKEMLSIQPTINNQPGTIGSIPLILSDDVHEVENIVWENIEISRQDWDSFETSWDFLAHPLVLAAETPDLNGGHKAALADAYAKWEALCENRFNQLKANEEELNRIFIDIYGLQDELTPEVEDKDVTVRKADLGRDIRSLLS